MMNGLLWKPWHKVVALRDDLRSSELTLAIFAADLDDVAMKSNRAREVYRNPAEFFALTYPTYNLRELAKDVMMRLAGKTDRAIRQLELTYGGGKTHTLITLYHLASDPAALPDLPAVQEFKQHINLPELPKARVAVISFDKLDVETGMDVLAPDGETRRLKQPWSVLAFQLLGAAGLRLLNKSDSELERETAPAENLMIELFSAPGKDGLATLILIDEVLMYAREKVGGDPEWQSRLVNFFQYMTQAATKVDRCAIVASLLATDPAKSDTLGKEIINEISQIFRRGSEEGVQPVGKEDVAEVLRRRFFKPDSIRDRESFRPHVVAALQGISTLDDNTKRERAVQEDRYLKSYPFHPDLTEVFYTKWTNLEAFQRTRGVLRTFASALRDAEKWDTAPLVSANVFLSEQNKTELSEAAKQLTNVATTEEHEGKKQEWLSILEGELAKAREIERDTGGIKHRELEQIVMATFLHSQPITANPATLRELYLLVGATRPDKIELEKALRRWTEVSWFLDESYLNESGLDSVGQKTLPKSWRLGSKPNLKQMHDDASQRISSDVVEYELVQAIGKLTTLTAGASATGAKVHALPERPSDIEDDGNFHYAVLHPRAASESGKPSNEARRFIVEKTSADRPRVNANAVVLVAPSKDGLTVARNRIRSFLAWQDVQKHLAGKEIDPVRTSTLAAKLDADRKQIPESIKYAYNIVVTLSEGGEVQAFKIVVSNESLFNTIKVDSRSRIQDQIFNAEALLPGGPYDLWREGETARRVDHLVGAFAQFPHLPKMLRRKEILDTLLLGAKNGNFVFRVMRPDHSVKTFWREEPDETALKDPSLEVVLPEAASLSDLAPQLLTPNELPDLWNGDSLTLTQIYDYFSGARTALIRHENYEEPIIIPRADPSVIDAAVNQAVKDGVVWLLNDSASLYKEDVPVGLLDDAARLYAPPTVISVREILPEHTPSVWHNGTTTVAELSAALSAKISKPLPWIVISEAISNALRTRLIEFVSHSGLLPSDFAVAKSLSLAIPAKDADSKFTPVGEAVSSNGTGKISVAEAGLRSDQIQDLADKIADITKAAVGADLKFSIKIELSAESNLNDIAARVSKILSEISDDLNFS